MTDRELLELAAKAIDGIVCNGTGKKRTGPTWDTWEWYGPIGISLPSGILICPLTNDGDALRLAVKLSLTIHQWDEEACVCNVSGTINEAVSFNEDICKLEATRRAIVRAAAEIGKALK